MRRAFLLLALAGAVPARADEAAQLIALVRPRAALRPAVATETLAAGLVLVYAFDVPRRPRYATRDDLARLGLDASAARARALANLRDRLGALGEHLRVIPRDSVAVLRTGHRFNTSRILDHTEWAQVAADMRGGLLMVPAADEVLVFGDAAKPGVRDELRALAREAMATAEQPIAATILRWSAAGWVADHPE